LQKQEGKAVDITKRSFMSFLWRFIAIFLCLLFHIGLISCSTSEKPLNSKAVERAGGKYIPKADIEKMTKVADQRIYVPVYAHIYYGGDMIYDLTTTLSIRNTDSKHPIYISSARYYNTPGNLIRDFLESSVLLPPMATLDYVVSERERTGGSGANFVVEWFSTDQVSEPIVESVMIGTSGQQGISFVSEGKVVK